MFKKFVANIKAILLHIALWVSKLKDMLIAKIAVDKAVWEEYFRPYLTPPKKSPKLPVLPRLQKVWTVADQKWRAAQAQQDDAAAQRQYQSWRQYAYDILADALRNGGNVMEIKAFPYWQQFAFPEIPKNWRQGVIIARLSPATGACTVIGANVLLMNLQALLDGYCEAHGLWRLHVLRVTIFRDNRTGTEFYLVLLRWEPRPAHWRTPMVYGAENGMGGMGGYGCYGCY